MKLIIRKCLTTNMNPVNDGVPILPPQQPQPGPLVGVFPNVYYNTVHSMDVVRQHPSFRGLPLPENVCVVGRESYKYVREEDGLWKRLHQGMLTTGYLNAALGFYEPNAAKILHLSRGWYVEIRSI